MPFSRDNSLFSINKSPNFAQLSNTVFEPPKVVINVITKSRTPKGKAPKTQGSTHLPSKYTKLQQNRKHLEPPTTITTTSSTQENSDLAKLGRNKGYKIRNLHMMQWNKKHTSEEGGKEARKSRTDNERTLKWPGREEERERERGRGLVWRLCQHSDVCCCYSFTYVFTIKAKYVGGCLSPMLFFSNLCDRFGRIKLWLLVCQDGFFYFWGKWIQLATQKISIFRCGYHNCVCSWLANSKF